jgi:DNA-binding MarR family transcriptional regulator
VKKEDLGGWAAELEHLADHLGNAGPDEVCCAGLTSRQCRLLRTMRRGRGQRISDLAAAAGISASAMTRTIEKLEARKLLRRLPAPTQDGRAFCVEITPLGLKVLGQIDALLRRRMHAIVSAIPPVLRPQVLAAIRLLNHSLSPAGCCQLSGEWPQITVCCSLLDGRRPAKQEDK